MTAISQVMIRITPNQIGLYPSATITGNITGVAINISDAMSRNMPTTTRKISTQNKINHAGWFRLVIHEISICGIMRRVMMKPNNKAAARISKIIPEVTIVDRKI